MTQEHTPGPWELDPRAAEYDDQAQAWIMERDTSARVATISNGARSNDPDDFDRATAEANARLIAAAPDLLKMLQTVVDAHDYQGALTQGDALLSPAIRDQIMHAINQAKGA